MPVTHRSLSLPTAALLLAGALAGCGSGHTHGAGGSPGAHAASGSLTLSQGRVPVPASPDVGVAYFTLTNGGGTADRLVAASSPDARAVMPMKDVTHDGAASMVAVPDLRVPAHGRTVLEPDGLHLMLQGLTRHLHVSDTVVVRLRFAHAGVIRVALPVTPLDGGSDTGSDMSNMPGM